MTGALQTHARKTHIAIDTLDFRSEVMPFHEDSVPGPPANGVYIYGLYLEGARWDPDADTPPSGNAAEDEQGSRKGKMQVRKMLH
jgi:hypothetical protein